MRISGMENNNHSIYQSGNNQLKTVNAKDCGIKKQGEDGVSQGIQQQLENAKNQLQELADNKDLSPEEKMEKQKEIKAQIADLNNQYSKRQMELKEAEQKKQKQQLEEQVANSSPKQETDENVIDSKKMDQLTQASAVMDQVHSMNRIKTKLQGESNVAKIEQKLDASRGNSSDLKAGMISNLESTVDSIEKKISVKMADMREDINKPMSDEEKAEIEREKAEKQKEEQNIRNVDGIAEREVQKSEENGENAKNAVAVTETEKEQAKQYVPIDILL